MDVKTMNGTPKCMCEGMYLGEGISGGEQHILRFQITVNNVLKV